MNGRTFNRTDWLASQEAWKGFGWQWQQIREIAATRGFIYPPMGTPHDDRDAENPSQRAIVWRALTDNPTELHAIVSRSRSWSEVVDRIIGLETRLRADADDTERDVKWDKDHRPTHREGLTSLKAIIDRIAAS